MKVGILTGIKPNPNNLGQPNGLIFEISTALSDAGCILQVKYVHINRIKWFLTRLGIYFPRLCGNYDLAIAYPFWMAWGVATKKNSFILGPDATTLVFLRHSLNELKKGSWFKAFFRVSQALLACISEILITHLTSSVLLVVSQEDVMFLKKYCKSNAVRYLPHPVFREQLVPLGKFPNTETLLSISVLMFGNFDTLRDTSFFKEIFNSSKVKILNANNIKFYIYGVRNKWISDYLANTGFHCEYYEWFNSFADLLSHSNPIMFSPLIVGGGTKTRTLMSIANGIPSYTTSHGFSGLEEFTNYAYINDDPNAMLCDLSVGAYALKYSYLQRKNMAAHVRMIRSADKIIADHIV
jgi:hypothetical protein